MNRILVMLAFAIPMSCEAAEKYALLIGVTTYENAHMNRSPLKYPEADATAVAELLKSSGYEVKVLLGKQATQKAIEEELTKFEQQGTEDGVVFIGLFGHGVQYGSDAYYCPYDVKLRKVTDAKGKTIPDENGKPTLQPDPTAMTSMSRLLEALNTAGAGNRILIADCCREDPSGARGRAFGSSVKISDLNPGTAAIFACSEGEKAFESDEWGHGALTKAFLDYCKTLGEGSDATVSTMTTPLFRSVKSMVKEKEPEKIQRVNPIANGIVDLKIEVKNPQHDEEKKPSNSLVLTNIDLRNLDSGELPAGWTTESIVGVIHQNDSHFIGVPAGSATSEIVACQSPRLSLSKDFEITVQLQGTNCEFAITIIDGDGNSRLVSCRCGSIRTGTVRDWLVSIDTSRFDKELYFDAGTLVIRRRGQNIELELDDDLAARVSGETFGTLTYITIGMKNTTDAVGLLACTVSSGLNRPIRRPEDGSKQFVPKAAPARDLLSPILSKSSTKQSSAEQTWSVSDAITVSSWNKLRFAGLAGGKGGKETGFLEVTDLQVKGNFTLDMDVVSPEHSEVRLLLFDEIGHCERIQLSCFGPRTGRTREWRVKTRTVHNSDVTHQEDSGRLTIQRSGPKFEIRLNSTTVSRLTSNGFGALARIEIELNGEVNPVGLTRLNLQSKD